MAGGGVADAADGKDGGVMAEASDAASKLIFGIAGREAGASGATLA